MHDYEDIASLNIHCWFEKKTLFKMEEKRLAMIVPPSLPLQNTLFALKQNTELKEVLCNFVCKI